MHLLRYIHLNPIKARYVNDPEQWKHSDYSEWILSTEPTTAKLKLRDQLFRSAQGYKLFVMDYEGERRVENKLEKFLFD